jgi:acyl-CoA thioester hydrolase
MEQQDGCHIAVVDARCRYKAPARYDDEVVVRTRLKNARESMVHFGYELVRDADGLLLAEGETMHVVIDREMKKTPIPEKYMAIFRSCLQQPVSS